jgi:hypothetical protein
VPIGRFAVYANRLRQAELGQCSRGPQFRRQRWYREHSPRFVWLSRLRQAELGQCSRGAQFRRQRWYREHSPRFDWLSRLCQAELGQCSRGAQFRRQRWYREHSPRFDWRDALQVFTGAFFGLHLHLAKDRIVRQTLSRVHAHSGRTKLGTPVRRCPI